MKNIIKILLASIVLILAPSCSLINSDTLKSALLIVAKNAASNAVYKSIQENPELLSVYENVVSILSDLDVAVEMTPEELTASINEKLSDKTNSVVSEIISNVIQKFFDKYDISWNDKIDVELIQYYLEGIIESIESGIELYNDSISE